MHNNTTPEDVPICEAVIKFVQSEGDVSQYWAHLYANGIDEEKLKSYDRPITVEPWYRPEELRDSHTFVNSLEHYLHILKSVHSSTDLNMFMDEASQHLDSGTQGLM